MKKLTAILITLFFVFVLAACGSEKAPEEDIRGTVSSADEVSDNQNSSSEEQGGSSSGSSSSGGSSSQQTAIPKTFSMGKTSNSTWVNNYIGLGCKLPSNWTFKTDEEIAQLNGITQQFIPDNYAETMSNASIVYDMFAQYSGDTSTVNVNLEKVTKLQLAAFNEEATLNQAMQISAETYRNMGFTNVKTALVENDIDGKKFKGMKITAEINGTTVCVENFMVKCENHIASVTVAAPTENDVKAIFDTFYWL